MKKILQKSLASMVSAALCLTAFVSCLTVSATRGTGAFTVESPSAKPGESVTVPVVITSNDDSEGIAAAIFDLTFNTNVLTPTAVAAPSTELDYDADYRSNGSNDGVGIYVDVDAETGLGTMRVLAFLKDSKAAPVPEMTANITFTVAAEAAVGDTPITLTNAQACDYGTADSNGIYASDEDFIDMTIVNGAVTVTPAEEDYITYTGVTYDVATSKITVNRDALSQKMKDVINEALAAGHAKPQLIVDVDGTEFTFPVLLTYGAGYIEASGFALTHMNLTVKMYIRLTADNAYVFNTNAYEVVLADLVAGMADTDSKAAALVGLNNEWLNTTESYVITDSIAKDEGLITYTDATYDVKTSKIKINRTALSQDMKDVIAGAVSNGSAKPQLIVDVEGTEFIFPVLLTYGAGYIEASGFALPHFTQNVKMYIRIVSGANGEYVVNTNAVTINLHNIVSAATGSNFANAYNTYYNAQ